MTTSRDTAVRPAVLTFGRHKGKDAPALVKRDPKYARWPLQQDWFQEKYTYLRSEVHSALNAMEADDDE
jgi:hypothetical protein